VVLNFSADEIEATVSLPPELAAADLIDLWTGELLSPPVSGRLTVPLPAWGFRVLGDGRAGS
jgi:hypothetical protein